MDSEKETWKAIGELNGQMSGFKQTCDRVESKVDEIMSRLDNHVLLSDQIQTLQGRANRHRQELDDIKAMKNKGLGLAIGASVLSASSFSAIITKLHEWFK